jgi:hypothetical protein
MLNQYSILRGLQLIKNIQEKPNLVVSHVVKCLSGKDKYRLKVEVNDLKTGRSNKSFLVTLKSFIFT